MACQYCGANVVHMGEWRPMTFDRHEAVVNPRLRGGRRGGSSSDLSDSPIDTKSGRQIQQSSSRARRDVWTAIRMPDCGALVRTAVRMRDRCTLVLSGQFRQETVQNSQPVGLQRRPPERTDAHLLANRELDGILKKTKLRVSLDEHGGLSPKYRAMVIPCAEPTCDGIDAVG